VACHARNRHLLVFARSCARMIGHPLLNGEVIAARGPDLAVRGATAAGYVLSHAVLRGYLRTPTIIAVRIHYVTANPPSWRMVVVVGAGFIWPESSFEGPATQDCNL
jgi:hypothetical protein